MNNLIKPKTKEEYLDLVSKIIKESTAKVKALTSLSFPEKGSIQPGQQLPSGFAGPIENTLAEIQGNLTTVQEYGQPYFNDPVVKKIINKSVGTLQSQAELTNLTKTETQSVAEGVPKEVHPLSEFLNLPAPFSPDWLKAYGKPSQSVLPKTEEVVWGTAKAAAKETAAVASATEGFEYKSPRRQILEFVVALKHVEPIDFERLEKGAKDRAEYYKKVKEVNQANLKWLLDSAKATGRWLALAWKETGEVNARKREVEKQMKEAQIKEDWTTESYLQGVLNEMDVIEKEKYPTK